MTGRGKDLLRKASDTPGLVALGHYSILPTLAAACGARVAMVATGSYGWAYLVLLAGVPFLVAVGVHTNAMCPRCPIVAPGDHAEAIIKFRRPLHFVHAPLSSGVIWSLVAAFIGLTLTYHPLLACVPMCGVLLVAERAVRIHSRLRPWCPECRNGGAGARTKPLVDAGGNKS